MHSPRIIPAPVRGGEIGDRSVRCVQRFMRGKRFNVRDLGVANGGDGELGRTRPDQRSGAGDQKNGAGQQM